MSNAPGIPRTSVLPVPRARESRSRVRRVARLLTQKSSVSSRFPALKRLFRADHVIVYFYYSFFTKMIRIYGIIVAIKRQAEVAKRSRDGAAGKN